MEQVKLRMYDASFDLSGQIEFKKSKFKVDIRINVIAYVVVALRCLVRT